MLGFAEQLQDARIAGGDRARRVQRLDRGVHVALLEQRLGLQHVGADRVVVEFSIATRISASTSSKRLSANSA